MAIGVCRECGQKISSEAASCPKCGAAKPYKSKQIGLFGWIGVGFVGFVAFTMCTPRNDLPTSTPSVQISPTNPTAKTAAQLDAENRAAMLQLKPQQLRPMLADKLLPVCQRENPSLNYIKTEVRGTAIYCIHSFYSSQSLSIGPLAKGLERFISDWEKELRHAGIKRVGVYGVGEYASGSYFDLK